jgi:hypothetical protein
MYPEVMDSLEVAFAVPRSVEPTFKNIQFVGTFPHVTNLIRAKSTAS